MQIILAPAKNMKLVEDSPYKLSEPLYLAKTQVLLDKLKLLTFDKLKKVYKASDEIVLDNLERLKNTELNDIIQGFNYDILDEFVRVMKNINIHSMQIWMLSL